MACSPGSQNITYSDTTPDEDLQALKPSSRFPSEYKWQGCESSLLRSLGSETLLTWRLCPASPAIPSPSITPLPAQQAHHEIGATVILTPNAQPPMSPPVAITKKGVHEFPPVFREQRWDAPPGTCRVVPSTHLVLRQPQKVPQSGRQPVPAEPEPIPAQPACPVIQPGAWQLLLQLSVRGTNLRFSRP